MHWLGSLRGGVLTCQLNLSLPLEWECHFVNPDHPAEVSSLGHLANSTQRVPVEGDWSHEAEWLMGASPTSYSGPS